MARLATMLRILTISAGPVTMDIWEDEAVEKKDKTQANNKDSQKQ